MEIQLVDVGVAAAAYPGEPVSGDGFVTVSHDDGFLVALVDALGHGAMAASAMEEAVATIRSHVGKPIPSLFAVCHEALRRSRGVAMSVADFGFNGQLTWLSVGNVDGVLFSGANEERRTRQHMVLRGGVVGYRLPVLKPSHFSLSPGDTLVMSTDGVESNFVNIMSSYQQNPQAFAEYILEEYQTAVDDALVLVAQYRGDRNES